MKSIALIVLVGISCVAGAKTMFKYNTKKGDVLRYNCTMNTDLTMNQMGHDMSLTTTGAGVVKGEVEDVGPDKFTFTTAFEDYTIGVSGGDPAMGGMADTTIKVPEMAGKRTRREMNMLGRELSSQTLDTMNIANPLVKQLAQGSRFLSRVLMELPSTPVGIGDSWVTSRVDTQSSDGGAITSEMKINASYLRDVDTMGHKCAVVGYTLTLSVNGKVKIQKQFDATISGDGTGKGTSYFDAGAGRLLANLSTIEQSQQMDISGQMNMVVSQSTTTAMKTVLIQ